MGEAARAQLDPLHHAQPAPLRPLVHGPHEHVRHHDPHARHLRHPPTLPHPGDPRLPSKPYGVLLIVSPNLCLDRILLVRGFAAGRVHRVEQVSTVAGGKGMNVARVALALGVPCTVTGFLAGPAGRAVYRLAMAEGIQVEPLWVSGEGRVCTIVVDPDEGETVLNEPGPLVGPNRIRALEARIRRHAPNARMVVMCGSLPPGAPEDTYARLVAHLPGVPAVVDASGPALRHAARSGPLVLKANRAELESAAGRAFSSLDQVIHAAQGLRNSGAGRVGRLAAGSPAPRPCGAPARCRSPRPKRWPGIPRRAAPRPRPSLCWNHL